MVHPIIARDLDLSSGQIPSYNEPQPLPASPYPLYPDFSSSSHPNIRSRPLPGVRCPTCAQKGKEVWVIPGRACSTCGTPCF
ncbi:hypothetical protein BD289DRAFT_483101 [Coniella lustricola]|uniref:Uncharacterized protein n=1 Tax=Coniella lustricola TaxID=2025994 RepID=A0A2T3A6K1_9PEZI|nr:hypothetical protein BD289DRAFT_483101 [Coniella lustricola]